MLTVFSLLTFSSSQIVYYLFPQKSLPLLRQSMIKGHMTIEGVKPPSPVVSSPVQPIAQPPPSPTVVTQQVVTATGTLTQRPVMASRPIGTSFQQLPVCMYICVHIGLEVLKKTINKTCIYMDFCLLRVYNNFCCHFLRNILFVTLCHNFYHHFIL